MTRSSGSEFFSEVAARRITKIILNAVNFMHIRKIFHPDPKPENILLASDEPNNIEKLADFGFAKREFQRNSFTTMCGTPSYVAPEILNGAPYGRQVDMWNVIWRVAIFVRSCINHLGIVCVKIIKDHLQIYIYRT
uniref:Protein kinase domain-containing protein n=1 Tax=Proboscia inermis TaxID=420281 RepID=A0A7S0C3Y0_9STRA|mmetsp:Transcript_24996/g.25443  ORF Transcript_24996/g.25443 Transcript_24996/m.25443 type:complete len:136 (+) Transcript_24996:1-408(+)